MEWLSQLGGVLLKLPDFSRVLVTISISSSGEGWFQHLALVWSAFENKYANMLVIVSYCGFNLHFAND